MTGNFRSFLYCTVKVILYFYIVDITVYLFQYKTFNKVIGSAAP